MYILIIRTGVGIFFYFSKEIDNRVDNGYYENLQALKTNSQDYSNKM